MIAREENVMMGAWAWMMAGWFEWRRSQYRRPSPPPEFHSPTFSTNIMVLARNTDDARAIRVCPIESKGCSISRHQGLKYWWDIKWGGGMWLGGYWEGTPDIEGYWGGTDRISGQELSAVCGILSYPPRGPEAPGQGSFQPFKVWGLPDLPHVDIFHKLWWI